MSGIIFHAVELITESRSIEEYIPSLQRRMEDIATNIQCVDNELHRRNYVGDTLNLSLVDRFKIENLVEIRVFLRSRYLKILCQIETLERRLQELNLQIMQLESAE